MITPIKDILEIDKIIRNTIIEESEFEANRVLNAISVRGQNLSKLVEDNIYMSYDLDDLIIIFEVIPNPSFNDNVTMEEDDGSITNYSNFYVNINGVKYLIGQGNNVYETQSNNIYLFLPKGTRVYFTSDYVKASSLYVFPLKGVN